MTQDHSPHALAPGTRIRDYTIVSVIGTGGFSIVYKAMDNALMREVAIKEYFPSSFAVRAPDGTVQPHSREADTFQTGIVSFLNEGKLLASFDHPALVRVYRCWEESGTAYLAMKLYTGDTLRQAVEKERFVVTEASIQSLLLPISETLELLHNAKCYHRDVAPDNILLSDTHTPVLLDFGAARRAIEGTQVFTAILKPGYAPIEQYGDGELKQGPWTDIYALAGVVHFALVGNAPPTAISRILKDAMPRWRDAFAGRLPDQWLDAFESALAVKPENRPQSIAEFRALLGWEHLQYAFEPVTTMAPPRTTIETARPASEPPRTGSHPATQATPVPAATPATVPPASGTSATGLAAQPATGPRTGPATAAAANRPATLPPSTVAVPPATGAPATGAPAARPLTELRADMAALDAIDDERTVVVPRPASRPAPAPAATTVAEDPHAAIAALAAAAAAAANAAPAPVSAAAPAPVTARAPAPSPAPAAAAQVRPRAATAPAAAGSRQSPALLIGIGSAVLVAAALGWYFLGRGQPATLPAEPVKPNGLAVPTVPAKDNPAAKPGNDVVGESKPSIPVESVKTTVQDEPRPTKAAEATPPKEADKPAPKTASTGPGKSADSAPPRESRPATRPEPRAERSNDGPAGSQEAEDEFDRAVFGKTSKRGGGTSPRCTTLNESFSLGNQLTDDEQKFLRERCSK